MEERHDEIIIYQSQDGTVKVDVLFENETVWLTQQQMALLFQKDISVISRHIKNIFEEGELDEKSNLHFLQIPNSDKPVRFYSLDVIISVGYRVKSHQGTQFRIWATQRLRDYIIKGVALNDERFKLNKHYTMKTALFYCGHPAQYHFLKYTMQRIKNDGWNVIVLIKTKDILEQLLQEDEISYVNIQPKFRKNSKMAILLASLERTRLVYRIAKQYDADILIGTDSSIAQAGWLLRKPTITTLEDDYDVIKNLAILTYPFTTHIIVPNICKVGKWNAKKIGYEGYMKLAYLHPNRFMPQRAILTKYKMPIDKPFIIVRMAKLIAHHDVGIRGLSIGLLAQIITLCESQGCKVYITSEIVLPEKYQPYQLKINHTDIHHILSHASLLISDSQSMSVEAAMLGVPSVRYSDFSGRISVLEELEKKYELTYGIKACNPNELVKKVEELLAMPNMREVFQERRQKMLAEKIDVTAFLTWFIENYPASAEEAKNADAKFWERFK